jgi:transcriptional regulator with XRE-family HTH domain
LGSKLKKTRESKKFTQSEVARLAGIHVNYYARIERGEENPSFDVLYAIGTALKVKVAELFPF